MIVQKVEVGGIPFLNKKILQEKGVKRVKILEEFKPVESIFEDGTKATRLTGVCSTQVDDPKQVKWGMNPTTQNYMIDKHGPDTAKWVGLEIDIALKQAGSASPGIYPKDCSLEKVLG